MTDTITLSRAMLEQALKALASYCNTGEIDGADDLLASLLFEIDQPPVKQEPIRWPANASEVRAFLSGHVAAERYARDDHQPDDSDTYTLSAHDLLGAIDWWTDFAQRPQQPLPPQSDIPLTQEQLTVFKYGWKCAESAHGIGSET